MRARLDSLPMYVIVSFIAFLVFLPWIQVYFLGDDWMLLARNSGRPLPDQLILISDASNSRWYRPLSELSLAASWSLFKLDPVGHHVVSFSLQALNAVLVAALGQYLARDRRVGLLAGVSFAVMACHTEAVVWITARHEMLASALALLGLASYIKYRGSGQLIWWIGAILLYVSSLGFKETTLALPLLMTLYDLIFIFPVQVGSQPRRADVGQWIPLVPPIVVGIVYLLFRLQVGGGYNLPFNVLSLLKNPVYYLLMETVALPDSTLFLSRFPLATLPVMTLLTMACAVSVWLAGSRMKRDRVVWFGAVWMVSALAPVILIVAERTTYFSSVGWAWAIAATVILAWDAVTRDPLSPKRWAVVLVAAVLLGANLVTLIHRSYWWSQAAGISHDMVSQPAGSTRVRLRFWGSHPVCNLVAAGATGHTG
jgi:hypothetical protein